MHSARASHPNLLCGIIPCVCLQVQYTALPHYEDKFEDFKADTVVLRRRFTPEGEVHKAGGARSETACVWYDS